MLQPRVALWNTLASQRSVPMVIWQRIWPPPNFAPVKQPPNRSKSGSKETLCLWGKRYGLCFLNAKNVQGVAKTLKSCQQWEIKKCVKKVLLLGTPNHKVRRSVNQSYFCVLKIIIFSFTGNREQNYIFSCNLSSYRNTMVVCWRYIPEHVFK